MSEWNRWNTRTDDIREWLKPGCHVRKYISEGNPRNCLMHILATVEDDYIVFKTWQERRQSWSYQVQWVGVFEVDYSMGYLKGKR